MRGLGLVLSLVFLSCGKAQPVHKVDPNLWAEADSRVENARDFAPTCRYTLDFVGVSKDTCKAENTGNGDADAAVYAGYLCLAGDQMGCATVKKSLGSDGSTWRSPSRVGTDTDPISSRDVLLGHLAYVVATRDRYHAERMLAYIERTNKICFQNYCTMTPTMWGLMYDIWRYLGLKPNTSMILYSTLDNLGQKVSAIYSEVGYRLGLVGINVLIRKRMGADNWLTREISFDLIRRQPTNPFYSYLAYGPHDGILKTMLNRVPLVAPASRSEWSIENDEAAQSWSNSMVWEWVFLRNLIREDIQ